MQKLIQETTPANVELRGTRPTCAHHPPCLAAVGCTIGALQVAVRARVFAVQESSLCRRSLYDHTSLSIAVFRLCLQNFTVAFQLQNDNNKLLY